MTEQTNQIKSFVEQFFKNLNCNLNYNSDILTISNIPEDFESFVGKKGPYIVSFSPVNNQSVELITKGSFLLKSMNSYLETRGTTTLIKLNFDRDYKEEFKHHFKLKNSEIHNISNKPIYKTITRFTFATNFQYLNEKESVVNDIYLKDGQILSLSIEDYNQEPGRKEHLPSINLREDYAKAKEALKPLLQKRISDTAEILKVRLEREQQRIKEHYSHHKKEYELAIQRLNNQIAQLEKDYPKSQNPEIPIKIAKIKESIQSPEHSENLRKLEKEEQFFLSDELHKHSLNIDNKLLNTSIIYYPIFNFSILLKNNDSARQLELTYNPFEDTLEPEVVCEVCKRAIQEIFLCSSGHINCNNCYEKCRECLRGLCSLCTKKSCDYCSKKLCKKCSNNCSLCFKPFCQSHLKTNFLTGKLGCINCLKQCSSCGKYTTPSKFKKTNDQDICEQCFRLQALKKIRD